MFHYALIGQHLAHSFSKQLFDRHFASGIYNYQLIETPNLDNLKQLAQQLPLHGFNVTIPYKMQIIPLLDQLDDPATQIGAVNTVSISRTNGKTILVGHNTDAPAFAQSLKKHFLDNPHIQPSSSTALVLGTGGAARAVAYGLASLGIDSLFVSRQPNAANQISYNDAYAKAKDCQIIVNATPVGMFPDCNLSPWQQPHLLTPQHLCYDLVYNPSPTRFLQEASQHGATTKDGLEMLQIQARLSWQIWGIC